MAVDRSMVIDITARDQTKSAVTSARAGFNSLAKGVGLVGAAVGGLGLGAMVKATLDSVDAQAKFADRLGISTKKLGGLQHAAGLTGVATTSLNMGLQRMTRRVAEAAGGTGEAVKALKELNLSAEAMAKLSPDEQFKAIAGAMEGVETQSDKVRLAFKLFDSEGVALINTLNLGAEGLDKVSAEADALGISLGRADAAKIEAANDALLRMTGAIQGAVQTLTVELAPIIAAVADKISDASLEAGGFKDGIIKFTEVGLVGAAKLGDVWRGWKLIFMSLELAWKSMASGVLSGLENIDRAVIDSMNGSINAVNLLIEGMNSIPGVGIPLIQNATYDETIAGIAGKAREEAEATSQAFWKLATEPLPSENIQAFIDDIKLRASEAAVEVASIAQGNIAIGGADPTLEGGDVAAPKEDPNEKLREDTAAKLEILLEGQMGEQELLLMDYEAKQLLLDSALNQKLLSEEAYNEAMGKANLSYLNNKVKIEEQAESTLLKIKADGYRKQAQYAKNAANIMGIIGQTVSLMADSNSKKDFETNKKVQMASSVVNTYAGATAALATYGGGPLGIAMAAITVAFGLAQLSKISSQSYEGGGGGGMSAPATPSMVFPTPQEVEVVEQPGAGETGTGAAVNYHIEVHGNIMDSDATARALIEPLEQARLDGVESEL